MNEEINNRIEEYDNGMMTARRLRAFNLEIKESKDFYFKRFKVKG